MGPTALLPLRRKAYWGFFRPKNPTASAGFEPANATSRPPKTLVQWLLSVPQYSKSKNSTFCLHNVGFMYVICVDLRTNSDYFVH